MAENLSFELRRIKKNTWFASVTCDAKSWLYQYSSLDIEFNSSKGVRCRGQGAVSDSQLCRSIVERGYGQNAIIMIINVNFEAWSRGASESLNEGGCRHQELVDTFSISDPLFKRSLSISFMFHCLGCCEKHLHLTMASCLISLAPLYIYCSPFILHVP